VGVRKRGTLPPAAWYPDPTDERRWRWWDGAAWTEHRVPRSIVAETPPSMPGPVTAGHLAPVEKPRIRASHRTWIDRSDLFDG
jgi:hypothetical protein